MTSSTPSYAMPSGIGETLTLGSLYEALKRLDDYRSLCWGLTSNQIQYEDAQNGFLIYITSDGQDTLSLIGWTLPGLDNSDFRVDREMNLLALHVASTEEPSILKSLSISSIRMAPLEESSLTPRTDSEIIAKHLVRLITQMIANRDTYSIISRIPTLAFTAYDGIAPFQATGVFDDLWSIYFRYRGGIATLKIGRTETESSDVISFPYWQSSAKYGGRYGNGLLISHFTPLFIRLFRKLEPNPVVPILYRFEPSTMNSQHEHVDILGKSQEDAFETLERNLETQNMFRAFHQPGGVDYESWTKENPPPSYNPIPISEIQRVYPNPPVDFRILPKSKALTLHEVLSVRTYPANNSFSIF